MNLLLDNQPGEAEFLELLNKLIQNWETEVAEFKEAGKDYDKNKTGQYFSAISDEATVRILKIPKTERSIRKVFLPKSVSKMLMATVSNTVAKYMSGGMYYP